MKRCKLAAAMIVNIFSVLHMCERWNKNSGRTHNVLPVERCIHSLLRINKNLWSEICLRYAIHKMWTYVLYLGSTNANYPNYNHKPPPQNTWGSRFLKEFPRSNLTMIPCISAKYKAIQILFKWGFLHLYITYQLGKHASRGFIQNIISRINILNKKRVNFHRTIFSKY